MSRVAALALLLACAAAAAGQSPAEKKRRAALEKLATKLGVPAAALDEVRGERLAGDAAARRALLEELGARPRGELLPLALELAEHEREYELRAAAIKLLSVLGLEADRTLYLERFLPALPRLLGDGLDKVRLAAMDEANLLARWFRCDPEVAPLLERTFQGKDFRLAQKAFYGLVELTFPPLREKQVDRALREVLDPRTRFGLFERKRAVLECGRRRGPLGAAELAELLFKDGPVAIECAQALGELGDPSVLPRLGKVDRTASHALRVPAYQARGKLGDLALLQELEGVFASDHEAIQRALVQALSEHPAPEAGTVLGRLAPRVTDRDLRREVALARLRRGDAGDAALLEEALRADPPDAALAGRVLAIEHAAAGELVLLVLGLEAYPEATRARAADRAGSLALEAARPALRRLLAGEPRPARLRAAASLLQLGEVDGVAAVGSALVDLDVVAREDVQTGVGKARRWSGSPLVDVCKRWARDGTTAALPLMAEWLDPPGPAGQAAPGPGPGPGDEASRKRAPQDGGPAAGPPPPAWPAWVRHPNVRRGVVEALGELARAAQLLPADRAAAAAPGLKRAIAALRRAADDPAALVRAAALGALTRLSQRAELPQGAGPGAEPAVRESVLAWVQEQQR